MADLGERIARWQTGDKAALDEMLSAVYDDRRRRYLRPTELVNEAYRRLVGQRQGALRRVRLHHAENRDAKKREGYANRVSLGAAALASVEKDAAVDIMALDRSMERLAQVDERHVKVVELRVFAGLTVARPWLRRELS